MHLGDDLDAAAVAEVARLGIRLTGAALADAVKTARTAARRDHRPLAPEDLSHALDPVRLPDAIAWRIAVHEAGHSAASWLLGWTPGMVSIVQDAAVGGVSTALCGDLATRTASRRRRRSPSRDGPPRSRSSESPRLA